MPRTFVPWNWPDCKVWLNSRQSWFCEKYVCALHWRRKVLYRGHQWQKTCIQSRCPIFPRPFDTHSTLNGWIANGNWTFQHTTCCRKLYGKCKALSFLSSIVTRVNSYATLAAAPSQDLTQNRHWDAVRKRNTKEVLNIWPEIRLTKISCISSFSAGCLIEWLSQHRSRDAAMWYLIRETEVVLLLPHLVMTNICTYPQSGNN